MENKISSSEQSTIKLYKQNHNNAKPAKFERKKRRYYQYALRIGKKCLCILAFCNHSKVLILPKIHGLLTQCFFMNTI